MTPLYDQREGRIKGKKIRLDREYEIVGEEGRGGSTIVYRAFYKDALEETSEQHVVLLRELYPLTEGGSVFRRADGTICWLREEEKLFYKERFLQGNEINLNLLKDHPSLVAGNLNSCEAYGTYYSILPFQGGKTLQERMEKEYPLSLKESAAVVKAILESLQLFHQKNFLHLDISPDNIVLHHGWVMLIDFNCVCSIKGANEKYYVQGRKEGYTAPEIYTADREFIGFPSDIYSVSAIFFQLLTGKKPLDDFTGEPLTKAGMWKCLKGRIPAFVNEPETAVWKTEEILLRGLDINPEERYQNVTQMTEEIDELLERIGQRGISRSVLWELGKKAWRQIPAGDQEYIPQEILTQGYGAMPLEEFERMLVRKHDIFLSGTGGMGKTRLLKEIAGKNMRRFDPKEPVYFYVSLRGYQNTKHEGRYILRQIIKNAGFLDEKGSTEDMIHELEILLDQEKEGRVTLILLLDGLNEAGGHRKGLLEEIEYLAKKRGVSALVTDRTDEALDYALEGFKKAELQLIPLRTVLEVLDRYKIERPGSGNVRELLRIPMMLELYIKNIALERDNGQEEHQEIKKIGTSMELVQIYLENQLTARKRLHSDKIMQLRDTYILTHLLPSVALEMDEKGKTILLDMEMAQVARRAFQNLLMENFREKFPEYRGYTDEILFDRNEDKWYGYAVTFLLCQELGLLAKTGDDNYQLAHDNFRSFLLWEARANEEQVTKKRIYIHELETDKNLIEYGELDMVRKKLNREYQEMGKERFLGTYQLNISFYTQLWRSIDLRYLLAMLEALNPDFPYGGQIRMGKPIVLDRKLLEKILEGDQELLDRVVLRTPGAYLKYGILL